MRPDPHLHIKLSRIHQRDPDCVWRPTRHTEADAAPQLGSWWILMVLMLAIMTSIAAAALIMLSHVVNAVLSIVWQT